MGKKLLHSILFLAGFVLLFGCFNHVFAPKNNSTDAGIHDDYAKGFLAEPANTLDVLILGDSEVYSCVAPLKIWEEQGITAYACGTSDQKLYQAEDFLRRAFETHSPKIIFLETNILYRDHSTIDVLPHRAEELFPLIRYHDRWKKLHLSDFTDKIQFSTVFQHKGYIYQTDILPADDSTYMVPSEDLVPIPSKNIRRVKDIYDFCLDHGAELVFFSSPSTVNWNYPRHNAVAQLAQQLGTDYLDMNLLTEEIPIDWQLDTRDSGDHMNYSGAEKISVFLGNYLRETALFDDKRTVPEFAAWNDALAAFHAQMETSDPA